MNELRDVPAPNHVELKDRRVEFRGPIFTIYNDEILFTSGDTARRQYMDHHDAVAVVALRDAAVTPDLAAAPTSDRPPMMTALAGKEVLLIRQYRHAAQRIFWEIPAGLRDYEGEDGLSAAQRELAEETDLQAEHWKPLVSFYASPGCSNENLDVYLAHGVSPISDDACMVEGFERREEEREIEVAWFALSDVLEAIQRGDLRSPTLVLGVLAVACEEAASGLIRSRVVPRHNGEPINDLA